MVRRTERDVTYNIPTRSADILTTPTVIHPIRRNQPGVEEDQEAAAAAAVVEETDEDDPHDETVEVAVCNKGGRHMVEESGTTTRLPPLQRQQ
jgi:hypothetical protein